MWRWIKSHLKDARAEMAAAEETLRHMDDMQILGAFEMVKLGELFSEKALRSGDDAAALRSLSVAFNRAGLARLRALERTGYQETQDDIEAQKRVDAWHQDFARKPDSVFAEEINEFLRGRMDEFAQNYPAVWQRLVRKNPQWGRQP